MNPEITVIIPTYNRASVLPRAVASVFGQTFSNFQLIVVDDGSVDGTQQYLATLEDPRLKILKTSNNGVSAARNLAASKACSEWLSFLDSDDEWLPDKLEKQLNLAKKSTNLSLIHGEEIWIRNGKRVNPMIKHKKKGGDVFLDSVRLCCISPSTVMLKKKLFEKEGGFREDFPVCEDYDLWLKITAKEEVGFVEEPIIVKYGGHKDQLSRKYVAMDYWRVIALEDILNKNLPAQQLVQARFELINKAEILLKGYLKHQNLVRYDSIFSILKRIKKQSL